jgi:hypothetical protein
MNPPSAHNNMAAGTGLAFLSTLSLFPVPEGSFIMTAIVKRIGYVVFACVIGALVMTAVAFAFVNVKALLLGGAFMDLGNAAIFGIGWGGAVLAICGALMGKENAEEKGKKLPQSANMAGWVVAVILALICLSVLFMR